MMKQGPNKLHSIKGKKHTNSGQLWVHLRNAGHIEEGDERFVGYCLEYKLAWIGRVNNALEALDN